MTGDILFLAHRSPFAPDRGDTIRSYHLLERLRELAVVHVGAFDEARSSAKAEAQSGKSKWGAMRSGPTVLDWTPAFAGERQGESRVLLRPARLVSALRGLAQNRPLSVAAFDARAMHAFVAGILAERPVDTIFAFSGQMAQFVPAGFAGRFVMDFVDVDSAKFAAYAADESGPRRWLHAREARLLERFEGEAAGRADLSLFVSEAEAALFRARHPEAHAAALENGIDLAHYDHATPPVDAGEGSLILFAGQMDYRPNIEAVTGFARDVFPLIRARRPEARFAIVGRDPAPAVVRLAGNGVVVTGEVADVRPWLARADVAVAPLRLARGIQNKVLEAMAMARPAIVSAAAFEGIDALPGRDLVVADDARTQAEAVLALLGDPARAAAIGRAARSRIEARYDWNATLAPLAAIVGRDAPLARKATAR